MNKNQQKKYAQALSKAETFYAKKNYQTAKQNFDIVIRLNPELIKTDQSIAHKINICQQHETMRRRKEDIKKARNFEKKNKFSQALALLEKAAVIEKEDWLEDKITRLKEKLIQSDITNIPSGLQIEQDPEIQLHSLKKLSAQNQDNIQLKIQMAQCYVKTKQYQQAIELYVDFSPSENTIKPGLQPIKLPADDNYYLGYAYLHTDELIAGLLQWTLLSPSHSQAEIIFSQFKLLLPFAIDELNTPDYDQSAKALILKAFYDYLALFDQLEADRLKSVYIERLWETHQYDQLLTLLQPFPDTLSLAQLELYAKLWFRLASLHKTHDYLEQAISFWLSAIYNDELLESLASFQQVLNTNMNIKDDTENELENNSEALKKELQERLLEEMKQLIDEINKETKLPDHINTLWQNEGQIIQRLHQLGNKSKTFRKNIKTDFFPCTPVVSRKFHLNSIYFPLISSNRRYLMGKHNQLTEDKFYELCCYYSPLAEFMFMADNNNELAALKSLAKTASIDFAVPVASASTIDTKALINYCQQKIAFKYAWRMLSQSAEKADKYFRLAIPLIVKYPEYAHQLSNIALSDRTSLKVYVPLAGIMEILTKQIKTARFTEAAAYSIAMKALHLNHMNASTKIIQKLLDKAISIDPHSHAVKNIIEDNSYDIYVDQIHKAFRKGNVHQAAGVVEKSQNSKIKDYFFNMIAQWTDEISALETRARLLELKDFLLYCRQIDKTHPITQKITTQIQQIEEN